MQSGAVEFAITIVSASNWDLDIEALIKESFVLVCPANHPLAAAGSVEWNALAGLPLVRVSQDTANRLLIDDTLGNRREALDWRYEVQRTATAVSLVRAGLALSILPAPAVSPTTAQGLAVVQLRNPSVARTLGILSRRDSPLSPLAQELRDAVRRYFREHGARAPLGSNQHVCVA